jgi:hypothetical protein
MLDFSPFLERTQLKKEISTFLTDFYGNQGKRSMWVYGSSGVGKTTLIKQTLKELNYDMIYYNSAHTRNKNMIEEMNSNLASPVNVYSMFFGKPKPIVVVMDELESMNLMDKHGIGALLQLIKPKKNEKTTTTVPIICISNECEDKRLKEMRKQSVSLYMRPPTNQQVNKIFKHFVGKATEVHSYINGDLHKLNLLLRYMAHIPSKDVTNDVKTYFAISQETIHQENVKHLCHKFLRHSHSFHDHSFLIHETDRTSLALLYHENIADVYQTHIQNSKHHVFDYLTQIRNMSYADYMDRITFQKQIWIFNEMSSLIKTMYNHYLFHKLPKEKISDDMRFTKILTKYSSEYNNYTFMQSVCGRLMCDERDVYALVWVYRNYIFELLGIQQSEPIKKSRKKIIILEIKTESYIHNYAIKEFDEFLKQKDLTPQELLRVLKYMNTKFDLHYIF